MKIAIQGHPTRGKEVISVLKSLGGKNTGGLEGTYETFYYIDDKNEIGDDHRNNFPSTYKLYTLEEFEKEFSFKVGDKVTDHEGDVAIITGFVYIGEKLGYSLQYENGRGTATPRILTPYKEMKEERNITLTLDKAKEWYNKGGELKEIALQAFTEKELNLLPRSWEEYCRKYGYGCLSTRYTNIPLKYDVLLKLEQLRDCWRQGWKPDWLDGNTKKYAIKGWRDKNSIEITCVTHAFLSFPTYELALEFQECFKDLIKKSRRFNLID